MSGVVREAVAVGAVRVDHNPERKFYQVGGEHPEKMGVLTEIFNRILVPLYGSQEKALDQIRQSADRRCYLLYEGTHPVGVLAFKTVLSDEFRDYGVQDSIEIKSLFVDNSSHNSGRGLGSTLVNKVKEEVRRLGLGHKSIHVTVSETKQESLMFFQKKGFEVVHTWDDRYQKGTVEYLLSCPEKIVSMDRLAAARRGGGGAAREESSFGGQAAARRGGSARKELVCVIDDAHFDDIHSLKRLADGTFVSGSKDNCLYKWDKSGKRVRIISEVEPTQSSNRNWITAVEVINDAYWLSGERSGRVSLWKTDGEYIRDIKPKLPGRGHFSRMYNRQRVNCLATGVDALRPSFFIGFPTLFDEFNFIEGRTSSATVAHANDWVFAIEPLSENRILTVTGCTVNLWEKTQAEWVHQEEVIAEGKRAKIPGKGKKVKWQRPFISSLLPLTPSKDRFALTRFGGAVEVMDLNRGRVVRQWREHGLGRVWAAESVAEHVFASCAEDGLIKFWDVREAKSVHTVTSGTHQVNTLMNLDGRTLVAGTSAETSGRLKKGAQIKFYDIRRFSS